MLLGLSTVRHSWTLFSVVFSPGVVELTVILDRWGRKPVLEQKEAGELGREELD